ncbi:MAG: hypothetical protein ACO2PM_07100 [Pyrobaculum sp.]|jgi:hypothetical protein
METKIVNRIIESLQVFYKWPAVYIINEYGFVDVLLKSKKQWWYKYEEPIGNVALALLYEGVKEISEETELRLIEVAVKHVKSRKIIFTFLGDIEIQHLYVVRPTGKVVKIYATKAGDGVVFTDVTQLKQLVSQIQIDEKP